MLSSIAMAFPCSKDLPDLAPRLKRFLQVGCVLSLIEMASPCFTDVLRSIFWPQSRHFCAGSPCVPLSRVVWQVS